jgi:hypothetical protein
MNIIQQNIYIADETVRIFIFHRLLNHRLFYFFFREMMGMLLLLSFWNLLINPESTKRKDQTHSFSTQKAVSIN